MGRPGRGELRAHLRVGQGSEAAVGQERPERAQDPCHIGGGDPPPEGQFGDGVQPADYPVGLDQGAEQLCVTAEEPLVQRGGRPAEAESLASVPAGARRRRLGTADLGQILRRDG